MKQQTLLDFCVRNVTCTEAAWLRLDLVILERGRKRDKVSTVSHGGLLRLCHVDNLSRRPAVMKPCVKGLHFYQNLLESFT